MKYLMTEANKTFTENGAVTNRSTMSDCLDLFATIGALRSSSESEIITRFMRAYAEDADLAMKILFFGRDVRGGLGERRVFKTVFRWLATNEPSSVKKNIALVAKFGRFDDLLSLLDTPCEKALIEYIDKTMKEDLASFAKGENVSLLAKWLPSVNASNKDTVYAAKKIARGLGMTYEEYRKTLSVLRGAIKIIENNLRESKYDFDYEKQPSMALLKYRQAFVRNDNERYSCFLKKAEKCPSVMHTGTLTPYDIVKPIIKRCNYYGEYGAMVLSEDERHSLDVTWNSLEDYVGSENALVVLDGSGSMYYSGSNPVPAAVAQSLAVYYADRNKGAFKDHFITFSKTPQLVKIKGRDIAEKLSYTMTFDECANTNLMATFELVLNTAVKNKLSQDDIPEKLYIISDMEFDCCAEDSDMTNFERAKAMFEEHGYKLPQIVFWNVCSRNRQQPVTMNEQGVTLVSGCSPVIFKMLQNDAFDPYSCMMDIINNGRYDVVVA